MSVPLTPYEHLLADYFRREGTVSDDHYTDFLTHVRLIVFESKDTRERILPINRRDSVTYYLVRDSF